MWIIPHIFSVLGFLLAVFLLSRILREHRPPASTMAWLLAIFLIPYIGIFFFLLLGSPKLPARRRAKQP